MRRNLELTSRRAATGNHQRVGSRGEGTQTHPHAEIIRLPSGSITSVPRLESFDLSQSGFNKPLLFTLIANFIVWGLLFVAGRWLISVFASF